MKKKTIAGFVCQYDQSTIRVEHSHLLHNEDVAAFCEKLKKAIPFNYRRTTKSWMKEIVSHTVLYQLGIFKSHTADTDIEEKESFIRLLSYNVIYYSWKLFTITRKAMGKLLMQLRVNGR